MPRRFCGVVSDQKVDVGRFLINEKPSAVLEYIKISPCRKWRSSCKVLGTKRRGYYEAHRHIHSGDFFRKLFP
jgi:hypothetical protein